MFFIRYSTILKLDVGSLYYYVYFFLMWLGELEFSYHYAVRVTFSVYGVHLFAPICRMVVQILLGLPFIISHPMAYISRSFNLGRVFIHFW